MPVHVVPQSIPAGVEVMVPLEGLVDAGAERVQLEKDLAKLKKEHDYLAGKLSNENFVKRAPAEVLDKDRGRLAEVERRRAIVPQLGPEWLVVMGLVTLYVVTHLPLIGGLASFVALCVGLGALLRQLRTMQQPTATRPRNRANRRGGSDLPAFRDATDRDGAYVVSAGDCQVELRSRGGHECSVAGSYR